MNTSDDNVVSIHKNKALKIIELNNFYDCSSSTTAQVAFSKMLNLKFKGYLEEYDNGVLPADTTDLFATHYIVTEQNDEKLDPIMAFKSVSLEKCRHFGQPFSGLKIVHTDSHREGVQEVIDYCDREGLALTYDSSWTIRPDVRKDRGLTRMLRDVFQAIQILSHLDTDPRVSMVCGITRFKTEFLFENWGYKKVTRTREDLPPFHHTSLRGEEAFMMVARSYRDEAIKVARQYETLWRAREVLSAENLSEKIAA